MDYLVIVKHIFEIFKLSHGESKITVLIPVENDFQKFKPEGFEPET